MAKYTVVYGCGHEVREELFGKEDVRQRAIDAAKNKQCRDCYKAAQATEVASVEQSGGLPVLQGSEKQVAWAGTIRAKLIGEMDGLMAAHGDKLGEVERKAVAELRSKTQAGFWIDSRNQSLQALLVSTAKEIAKHA